MLLKVLKKTVQKEPQVLKQDAFRILSQNLLRACGEKSANLMITSTSPSEGKEEVCEKLSAELSSQGSDVLLIQADALVANPLKSEIGLSNLYAYLTEKQIHSGELKNYGLSDLLFLAHINHFTGSLALKSPEGDFTACFRNGILCSLKTPREDLCAHLPFLNQLGLEQCKNLKQHCHKKQLPLIHGLWQRGLFDESELRALYSNEIFQLFTEFREQNFSEFAFHFSSQKKFKSTVSLLKEVFLFADEPLHDQGYIARCLQQNVFVTEKKYFCMPRGSLPLDLGLNRVQCRLRRLMATLKKHFDHIILNAPPLTTGPEAWALTNITDQTVLVIRSGTTQKDKIAAAVRGLQENHVAILGTVLTDAAVPVVQEYCYEG